MRMSRLRRARYTLDLRMKGSERQKLKTGKKIEKDLKTIERLMKDAPSEEKLVEICRKHGLSKTYTKILAKRIRRRKAFE